MKGAIVINPYLVPESSVLQAKRISEEFERLGVRMQTVTDGFLRASVGDGKIQVELDCDFVIYLDKDKYFSSILEKSGYKLFNSHSSIRVCDDKAQTYIALSEKGIKVPKTIFGALCFRDGKNIDEKWVDTIIGQLGLPLIVKECYGSLGANVYKADTKQELIELMKKVQLKPHLFQEYIDAVRGTDIRVIVIGGKTICAMKRYNPDDFRSNVALGGDGEVFELPDTFKKMAEDCASALGLDYCGVDLLIDKDGNPVVCEVNSNAFFDKIEKVTGVNVAKEYAKHVIDCVKE